MSSVWTYMEMCAALNVLLFLQQLLNQIVRVNSPKCYTHIHTSIYTGYSTCISIILCCSTQSYFVFDVQILLLYGFVVVSQLKIEMGIECFINI